MSSERGCKRIDLTCLLYNHLWKNGTRGLKMTPNPNVYVYEQGNDQAAYESTWNHTWECKVVVLR